MNIGIIIHVPNLEDKIHLYEAAFVDIPYFKMVSDIPDKLRGIGFKNAFEGCTYLPLVFK